MKEYIASIVYGKTKDTDWGKFLVFDNNNTVWSYNKNSYEEPYESKKLAENIKTYFVAFEGYSSEEWAYYNKNRWFDIDPYV